MTIMTAFVLHTQEYSQACIRGSGSIKNEHPETQATLDTKHRTKTNITTKTKHRAKTNKTTKRNIEQRQI
jgi:hypothetical protein